jgi:hypothetical protein
MADCDILHPFVGRFSPCGAKKTDKEEKYYFPALCRFFFVLRDEKEPTKEEKYHAAAG